MVGERRGVSIAGGNPRDSNLGADATPSSATNGQILLARLVVALLVAFVLAGLALYGLSWEVHDRIWQNLVDRPGGPMTFRFILQPCMAAIAAIRDGVKDAKSDHPPYLWSMVTDGKRRWDLLGQGVIATARVLLLGLVMDAVYQWIVLKTFYPGEAAIMAIALAFIPYLVLRGPIDRLARWRLGQIKTGASQ